MIGRVAARGPASFIAPAVQVAARMLMGSILGEVANVRGGNGAK